VSARPTVAYKVLTSEQMVVFERDGAFTGAPVDLADGFIHMSTAEQIDETVAKHFAGQTGLFVLAVDLGGLGDAVKWEPSRGGALFPHLFAPLRKVVVLASGPLARGEDGKIVLP
jgi:uncharacterized protein (DUF952 family)